MPCGGARLVQPQYSHGEDPGLYSTIHGCRAVLRFINRNTPLDEAGHTRKGVDVASGARSRRFESCLGHQQFVCTMRPCFEATTELATISMFPAFPLTSSPDLPKASKPTVLLATCEGGNGGNSSFGSSLGSKAPETMMESAWIWIRPASEPSEEFRGPCPTAAATDHARCREVASRDSAAFKVLSDRFAGSRATEP